MSPKSLKFQAKQRKPAANKAENDEDYQEETQEAVPKDVLVIAQEIKIVKALACNDVNKRNKQIRKLAKWLKLRSKSTFSFNEEDFLRMWKGLYYNMWMADKPLFQEELAEQLAQLLECFDGDMQLCVRFFGAFIKIMCLEWFGIDQWRIDKFLMLVRRMMRYMFKILRASKWCMQSIKLFNEHMLQTVLAEKANAIGLTMHFLDIFFEELAKVSEGEIDAEVVGEFTKPFVVFMATQKDGKLIAHCRTRVFYHLLYQSGLGREYSEKYKAWKDMGFPTAHIDDLEKIETDSQSEEQTEETQEEGEEQNQKHLDPRAGNVDVFMPELPLDAKYIIEELEMYIYKKDSTTKKRKMLKKLLEVFQKYRNGEFPLGVKTMPRFEAKSERPLIKEKVQHLENLENEMFGIGRKLKQLNKRKRRKLLKSLNFTEVDDANYEQFIEKSLPKQYLLERRKRSKKALMNGWLEEELDEEAVPSKKPKVSDENEKSLTTKTKKSKQTGNEQTAKLGKKQKLKKQATESVSNIQNEKKVAQEILEEPTTSSKQALSTKADQAEDTSKNKDKSNKKSTNSTSNESEKTNSEWDNPPQDGEIEYFIPSRKLQLKKANSELVLNPVAAKKNALLLSTPKNKNQSTSDLSSTPRTPGSVKRVKIALKHNTAQAPHEYIKQLKSSPNVPYDANKKPGKGLLKPNSMPSPINPFYKKKIGLRLLNETL